MPDPSSPAAWGDDGTLTSRVYGDVYFSRSDGLAESRAVFLEGCGLPDAWAGRRAFTIAELGFGTGLNMLAVLDLWRRAGPPDGRLHLFSIEAHPLSADDARRALARWPDLADLAVLLTDRWPGRARGFHRVDLPALRVRLDVAVLEAAEALEAWRGRADAWFLDGFSPALNPQMWRTEVLDLVAARSNPGARAGTYSVAGAVRRGLAAAGFEVERRPGFAGKRQRLEARLPGASPLDRKTLRVAIIGAGIAGAALAWAFAAEGISVQVFETAGPGAGASGNPAALVTPRLDAGLGPEAALFAQAWRRAAQLYEGLPDAVIARGVLQLEAGARDPGRFDIIAGSDLFEPGAVVRLSAAEAGERLGESAPAGLDLTGGLTIRPAAVLRAWLPPAPTTARVAALERDPQGFWRLLGYAGEVLAEAEAVCLAAGPGSARLAPGGLPLSPVRGQATWSEVGGCPAAGFGGYVAPAGPGVLFGATFGRDDDGDDVRAVDEAANLATLRAALPALAERLTGEALSNRASVRAVTPGRLPLAGALAEGLYCLTGMGSRGFTLAPLLAEHVAALVLDRPSPLPGLLADLVDPLAVMERLERRGRFERRAPLV